MFSFNILEKFAYTRPSEKELGPDVCTCDRTNNVTFTIKTAYVAFTSTDNNIQQDRLKKMQNLNVPERNLGSLPLIIVPAICKGRSHPFGDVDACYRKGLAFTSLTMAVGHIYAWSIVYNILRIYSPKINIVKFNDNKINIEVNNLENIAKCSARTLTTIEEKSVSNGCVDQSEIECKVIDGEEKSGSWVSPSEKGLFERLMKCHQKFGNESLFLSW
ncbi:hypothetical protein KIW84_063583 [Lathyrus oleraceus]|uniref:Uncharacterized protein n=1 Tax=Pisum sativum TaxID=3888 RepID=A0A9D4W986_PEA|nr:hypothetical protein KIW84_063583 [Pisum sativum]